MCLGLGFSIFTHQKAIVRFMLYNGKAFSIKFCFEINNGRNSSDIPFMQGPNAFAATI